MIKCFTCKGTGKINVPTIGKVFCGYCDGDGKLPDDFLDQIQNGTIKPSKLITGED